MRRPGSRVATSLALSALLLSASACTLRLADLTLAASGPVALDGVDLDQLPRKRAEGEDTRFALRLDIWPVVTMMPSIAAAVDKALQKGGGDLLTDAVIEWSAYYVIFGDVHRVRVRGDVVNTRQRPAEAPTP